MGRLTWVLSSGGVRHVFGREERALEMVVVEGVGKGEEEVRHVEQGRESWR